MQSFYGHLIASPFALSLVLLHLVVLVQCAIKLADYTLTKQELAKLS